MKTNLKNIGLLFLAAISFVSCNNDDNEHMPATAADFADVRQAALDKITQEFTITAENGATTLTSEKGVKITINGNCLTKNGNTVTGEVKIEYVDISAEEFNQKMKNFQDNLNDLFQESKKLENEIQNNLKGLRYEKL